MSTLKNTLVRHVDEQLRAILEHPAMWGSNEAVELQVLQLLEIRSVTLRPELERRVPRTILDAYHAFIAQKFPGAPPTPLFVLTRKEGQQERFIPLLQEFCKQLVQQMQPEDVFGSHDVVLRLWLSQSVHVPRASTLSSYYGVFQRVMRALTRPGGTRGRTTRKLESAIDFALPEVLVAPANGAPAHITLPLDEVEPSQAESVRQGLEQLVAINEWAAVPSLSLSELSSLLPGEGAPEHVAAQALRLMPSKETDIEEVELGGRLIQRPSPLVIRASYARRMLQAVKMDSSFEDFNRSVSLRAIDIDQRSLRIVDGKHSLRCWLEEPNLLERARPALGQRVTIKGRLYKQPGSPRFIIASDISS